MSGWSESGEQLYPFAISAKLRREDLHQCGEGTVCGVHTSADHCRERGQQTGPQEGALTSAGGADHALRRGRRNRRSRDSTSSSRPKKKCASSLVNGRRPGYGLCSDATQSHAARVPAPEPSRPRRHSGPRATGTAHAEAPGSTALPALAPAPAEAARIVSPDPRACQSPPSKPLRPVPRRSRTRPRAHRLKPGCLFRRHVPDRSRKCSCLPVSHFGQCRNP